MNAERRTPEEKRARAAAYARAWRAKNPDKVRATNGAHRAANREVLNARARNYRATRLEVLAAKASAHYWANRERIRARVAEKRRIKRGEAAELRAARIAANPPTPKNILQRLNGTRARARKQGVVFDLTPDWYVAELAKGCAVTRMPFAGVKRDRFSSPSIDRINAGGPYTQANCRLVFNFINVGRSNWDLEMVMAGWLAAFIGSRPGFAPP